jgi:hypothetical protein
MRAISILILWLTAAAVSLTLWSFGLVQHYWYFSDSVGLGYDLAKWQGDTLDNSFGYPKGYRYRYSFARFEKDVERRTISIILVLASACGATIIILMCFPKRNRPNQAMQRTAPRSDA